MLSVASLESAPNTDAKFHKRKVFYSLYMLLWYLLIYKNLRKFVLDLVLFLVCSWDAHVHGGVADHVYVDPLVAACRSSAPQSCGLAMLQHLRRACCRCASSRCSPRRGVLKHRASVLLDTPDICDVVCKFPRRIVLLSLSPRGVVPPCSGLGSHPGG